MTINLSSLIPSGGGGGGLPQLAPDLTYPLDKASPTNVHTNITGIDATGGLTTALSLTGKFVISRLHITGTTTENITIKLTIDGIVIWNTTVAIFTSGISLLGGAGSSAASPNIDFPVQIDSSLLLEVQTITDTDITLGYLARPII